MLQRLSVFLLALALLSGCGKSSSPDSKSENAKPELAAVEKTPILKFHWLGKKRLATEANATNFMAIWHLPESAKLEAQTLDKLATAPWRLWQTNQPLSNAPVALLRPLLDDLVQEEVYVEATGGSNQLGGLVFAIRLPAERTALWQSNLPVVLGAIFLTNYPAATPDISRVSSFDLPFGILQLSRSNDWTLLSLVRHSTPNFNLQSQFHARLAASSEPYPPATTNHWLELEFDAQKFGKSFQLGWTLPDGFPQGKLEISGDGVNVRTRGELNFLNLSLDELPAWNLPFHLTLDPLTGFSAMRAYKPVLRQLGILAAEQVDYFPEQFLGWLRFGPPLQIYFAYPVTNSIDAFTAFAYPITNWINNHADARRFGAVVYDATNQTYIWNGLSLCAPFLRFVPTNGNAFIHGGFGFSPTARPRMPKELHDHVLQITNLIYFDWEHTHDTVPKWRYFDDVSRMIFDAAHVSRLNSSRAAVTWFQTNLALTNFSHALTEVRLTSSNQLAFTRRSTVGLTALELDILANWVELPEFPAGMSSLWRTNPAPLMRMRNNQSAASPGE